MKNEILLSSIVNPTKRQREFIQAMDTHAYTLFGGAKSGGKSYILRWALVRQLVKWAGEGFIGVRAGLFCEDYPTLRDRQATKINTEFPRWLGELSGGQAEGLAFKIKPEFGGGVIALRNLDDPSKYASSEFAIAAVDELTKNRREVFDQLRSIIRWPGIEDTKFIAGTNPGDIGHQWVKKLFVDKITDEHDPDVHDVAFIRSLPTDNPYNAKSYLEELQKLPDALRRAYWEGNWDVFEGQFFNEWDAKQHVIEPFVIPEGWKKIRCIDVSGRNGITACLWLAIDWDSNVVCYREYYKTGLDADEHAVNIARLSEGESYVYSVMDKAAWSKLGLNESIFEVYNRMGVYGLLPSSGDRVARWTIMHSYLRWNKLKLPRLRFFNACANIIRTLPLLIHDEKRVDDLDTSQEDHAADAISYGLHTLRGRASEPDQPRVSNAVVERLAQLKQERENYTHNEMIRNLGRPSY